MPSTFYLPVTSMHSLSLWVGNHHSLKLVLRLQLIPPSSFSNKFYFQNFISSIPNWLLSAHRHCMLKAYFSDLCLTYVVLSSSWVTTWESLFITLPKLTDSPPCPPFLTHCLAIINLRQPDNEIFSGDQQGVGKPHGENKRLISYYYDKYLCTSQSSTNVLSSQHCWERVSLSLFSKELLGHTGN